MTRVYVYIDGLNLYGGIKDNFDGRGKWLDLEAFADQLADEPVARIWYFTSDVRELMGDTGPVSRQRTYLSVVAGMDRVRVRKGYMTKQQVHRWHAEASPEEWPFPKVWDTKEKGSDVALAVQLVEDAFNGFFDRAIMVSNDTDLVPAIQAVTRLGRPLTVIHPSPEGAAKLRNTRATVESLWLSTLLKCQLPDMVVTIAGRTVTRPPSWKA